MGFFGTGPYENDFALDWLAEHECAPSPDALLMALELETVRPPEMEADAAAFVLATAALLLYTAGVGGYETPPSPHPVFSSGAISGSHWTMLLPLMNRVGDSEILQLLRRNPEAREDWLQHVARVRADVERMCTSGSAGRL